MIIAFTGTREGMSDKQKSAFTKLLAAMNGHGNTFLHGGCHGADMEAMDIVRFSADDIAIECYPGDNHQEKVNKAYHQIVHPIQPYLLRNDVMVFRSDLLIAAPSTAKEQPKGGTWFTIRKAREREKPCVILDR